MRANRTNLTKISGGAEVQRFLTFALGAENYAVPLLWVREVIGQAPTTPIPFSPPHFLGILNLRDRIVSIIDLRRKFNMSNATNTRETSIIISDLGTNLIGVVVDSIDSVMAVAQNEIAPPPQLESSIGTEYIRGVVNNEKKLVLLLDISKALSIEDLNAIEGSQAKAA